ncbi:MAG: discoidin domain-containing protein [Rikenellaceae bacterium]|nr:discoidin domain-containing protein [Rikenellaceae bacterium]
MGHNLLYLPVYYADGSKSPANYPFRLGEDGLCRFFDPEAPPVELVFEGIAKDTPIYLNLMLDGRFEGANRADFSDARLLHRIQQVEGGFYHTVPVESAAQYRYVRYVSPDSSRCNVGELEFFDTRGERLTGTVIGSHGSDAQTSPGNAFDGNVATVVQLDPLHDAWIGLDLGVPTGIGQIRYLPRTNGKNIYEGHRYRLTYWDGHEWVTTEEQTATGHRLHCRAPENTIFYLYDATQKVQGSYFVLEDGVQRWLF